MTTKKAEGPQKFNLLTYQDVKNEINNDFYTSKQDKIAFKQFYLSDFRQWAKNRFDFLVFVVNSEQGLPTDDVEFIEELYQNNNSNIKLFKVFNVFHGYYREDISKIDDKVRAQLDLEAV